jgi:16S rRNA processing protein RimM
MDDIDIDKCTKIGRLLKPHGLNGELTLQFEEEFELTLERVEFVFLEIEGGLVPFFITDDSLRFRTHESAIIKFDDFDSQEKAKEVVNCNIFVFNKEIVAGQESESDSFIDYGVFDKNHGFLGKVTDVDDFSGNIVITVLFKSNEVMIPLSDEIVTELDYNKKELHLICPDGLLDIYSEQ